MLSRLVPSLAVFCALPLAAAEAAAPAPEAGTVLEVTATRLDTPPFQQPYAYYRHEAAEIGTSVGRTLLDRINYGPGVFIQRTAPAQASPFIRGLTGEQTLLMIDGVRLSHAGMRPGPNQYAAMVPAMSVRAVDVILGSSGVVTGSDGLTGALDFRLAEAGRGVEVPVSPWASTRVDSANGAQIAAGVDGALNDWRYSFEASFYDFHDRVGGKDLHDRVFGDNQENYGEIPNTAYEQTAVAARGAYVGLADHRFEAALGYTRQDDAPRPDGYFENSGNPSRISRYFDPQSFTYLHLRHEWTPENGFLDRLQTTAWWHRHHEAQFREQLSSGNYRRREYEDSIDSIGLDLQATSVVAEHQITYGATAITETTSNEFREFRNPGGTDPAGAVAYQPENWDDRTTLTDGSEYTTFAVFVQDLWRITDRVDLLGGLRFTHVAWDFDVADGDAQDVSGSLRATWRFRDDMNVFAGVAKGFRAPNLTNLDGATDRGSSGTPAFGNPDLDPEVSYTVEAGWRYQQDRDQLAFTAFYTQIDDLIQTVFPAGGGAGEMANGESAELRGFETLVDYGLPVRDWLGWGGRLAVIASLSLVDSENEVPQSDGSILEEPISRANRLYGSFGLRYDLDEHWWVKAQTRFHDAYDEDDIAEGDAGDVRLTVPGGDDGTLPGYAVLDVGGGWQNLDRTRWVSLMLENLADKTYRELGSGTDAAGFNVMLAGGVRF